MKVLNLNTPGTMTLIPPRAPHQQRHPPAPMQVKTHPPSKHLKLCLRHNAAFEFHFPDHLCGYQCSAQPSVWGCAEDTTNKAVCFYRVDDRDSSARRYHCRCLCTAHQRTCCCAPSSAEHTEEMR